MATFQVKDFLSIVASMINYMRASQTQVTDFNVGSVARSMLEAPAAEIDQLYQQMLAGLAQAIPVSVFNSFDFPPLAAVPASGLVRVTITSSATALTIVAGTRLTRADGSASYLVAEDVTIAPAGTYGDVRVVAEIAGLAGNLATGTTFTLSPSPTGFISAVALAAFTNGADQESDASHKARFNGFISSLARGTGSAILYGLGTVALRDSAGNITERVALSSIEEPWIADPLQPPALVNVRIHNGVGTTSADLVAEANRVIFGYTATDGTIVPGWKAAGVKVVITAATEQTVAVTATVTLETGANSTKVLQDVQSALSSYLLTRGIGVKALRAELFALAMAVDGVANIAISAPAADVAPAVTNKVMPGTFTLTAV